MASVPPSTDPPRVANWRRLLARLCPASLGLRLTVLLGLLMVASGAIAGLLESRRLTEAMLGEARLEVLRMADTIKRSTRHDMLNTRGEDVHETVRNIGGQPGLHHVRIYNKDGRIRYSSKADEIATVVDMTAEACFQCHAEAQPLRHLDQPQRSRIFRSADDSRVLAAIDVIYNEPGCASASCHLPPERQSVLGVVDVGVSLRAIDDRITAAASGALGNGILTTLLVCALIGLFVYSFVSRPVRTLVAGIEQVAAGDLDASLPVHSTDEIGQVALAFNRMTADLAKARGELRRWAGTLEQQVAEKTRDLGIAQAQVMRAEKLSSLGILAAGVAHELNSPLTGILTFATLMLQDAEPGSQQRDDLQLIIHETNRCAAIIRQLLDFSRESGPQKQPHDVGDLIRRTVALVQRQALFQDVAIVTRLEPGLARVSCDASQIEQVLLNLLINAAEAMPDGGTITLRALAAAPDRVQIQCEDTGVGIPAANLGKVFDPFFTSKAPGRGTGLGLSVSYGIVRRHGGTITVTSQVGVGTCFTIALPALVPAEVAR